MKSNFVPETGLVKILDHQHKIKGRQSGHQTKDRFDVEMVSLQKPALFVGRYFGAWRLWEACS